MKRNLLLFLGSIICLFVISNTANAQWEDIGGVCTEDNMTSVFQENDTIYAISDTEMYRSYDFGENWVEFNYANTNGYFSRILKFGHKDSIFAVITEDGIFMSRNYGITWEPQTLKPNPYTVGLYNRYLVSFYFEDNNIYAVNASLGIYKLTENDTVFRQLSNNSCDYLKDSLIICSYNTELLISIDYGATWTTYQTNLQYPPLCFFQYQSDIYNCNQDGLFKSSDQGANWTDVSHLLPTTDNLTSFLIKDNIWFLGTKDSILMQSNDFGNTWEIANMGLPRPLASDRIINIYKNGRTLYLTYSSNGIFKSIDGGFTWKHKSKGMKKASCSNIAAIEDTIFANYYIFEACGLYRSYDNGLNWESINSPEISVISDIITDSDKLYISDEEGILVSYDRGNSWQRILSEKYVFTFDVEGSTIIASIYDGPGKYMISRDAGQTWFNGTQNFDGVNSPKQIKIIGNNVIFNNNRIYYSSDQGNTFINIASGIEISNFEIDYDGTNIILRTYDDVYFSDNHGTTWDTITPSNSGPATDYLSVKFLEDSIILSSRADTLLYSEIGVWNWQKYTDGLDDWACCNITKSNSYLLITGWQGMFRRPLNRPPSIVIPPEVEVFIYPNPSNDIFQVRINDDALIDQEISQITIYNMQFQEMKTTYPAKKLSEISINCSGLRPGMYIVSINAGGKFYSQRFIKN